MHIGSQLTELEPFRLAYEKVAELTHQLRADGHDIRRLDLGGGLGIPYTRSNEEPPLPTDYGALIKDDFGAIWVARSRSSRAACRRKCGYSRDPRSSMSKKARTADFLILDAAMNDLIRPAMYDAHHDIVPVEAAPGTEPGALRRGRAGLRERAIPSPGRGCAPLGTGDLVAFRSAGAYGAVMASEYNTRPLVPEVLVNGHQFAVIRQRPTFDEIINRDTIPEWL